MEASFWHEKWENNQIGFHKDAVNPLLVNHIDKLKLKKQAKIFLPLCGKTLDIPYLLERGYQVVGIELNKIAIEALFAELKLTPDISKIGEVTLYKSKHIEIYLGDLFNLSAIQLGPIDAIYDRASLIALPYETRLRYCEHLTRISQNAPQLTICLDYDQSINNGPPFSVTSTELKQHYADEYELNCVESHYSEDGLKGKYPVTESVWILT